VDHLDIVTRAGLAHPIATRLTIDLSGSFLEDGFYFWPSGRIATGHKRRTVACTLLATGDTSPNKKDALSFTLLRTADGVGVMGITTINDDVALLEIGDQLSDEIIDSRSSLNENNNFARTLEL